MRFSFVTRRQNSASFMWWLVVGLLIAQGMIATLVLCIGANGHVAMEPTHVPVRGPLSAQHGGEPCLDVPVLASAEKSTRHSLDGLWRLASDDRIPALPPHALLMPSEADGPFRRLGYCDPSARNSFLLSVRTVILLT